MERATQEEQNDTNFSFIAPSSEELYMSAEIYSAADCSTYIAARHCVE